MEVEDTRYQKGQPVPLLPNPISQTKRYVSDPSPMNAFQDFQGQQSFDFAENVLEKKFSSPGTYNHSLNYSQLLPTQSMMSNETLDWPSYLLMC